MSKILFISHTPDFGVFKVGSHHLARELSKRGHHVAHVSTPYSMLHRVLRKGDEARRTRADEGVWTDEFGVLHCVPTATFPMRLAENRRVLARALQRINFLDADFILIDQPLMSVVTRLGLPGIVIYRPTDLYPSSVAARRQRDIVKSASGVIATTEPVIHALGRISVPSLVVSNGVESFRFAVPQRRLSRRGLIYVGAIDFRFDWPFVQAVAAAFPGEEITLHGPIDSEVPELPSNVFLPGAARYEDVPRLLWSARVGLLPLAAVEVNVGRSPMKMYEYIAAGLPVVTRNLGRPLEPELTGLVYRYTDSRTAIRVVGAALESQTDPDRMRVVAAAEDWAFKAAKIEAFLERLRKSRVAR